MVSGIVGTNPDVRVFRGIPFAAPPTGNLRWRAPQPVAHWDSVRKGDEFGPICMQAPGRGGASPKMSEDCLYLNVWTAAKAATERRPVLFWIHPGGYTSGSGSSPGTDGEALAKKGVVVVTINYRLGVLGFFAHPELTMESDRRASGNYALMDQTAALEWVQKNIAGFGGDPRRVTVDGDSAGAASIGNLMGSPRTKGLFQRAIAESGAWIGLSVNHTMTLAEAEQAGVKTAETLGAPSLANLRAKPAADVLKLPWRRSDRRWLFPPGGRRESLRTGQAKRCARASGIEQRRRNVLPAADDCRKVYRASPPAVWRSCRSFPEAVSGGVGRRSQCFATGRLPGRTGLGDAQLGKPADEDREVESVSVLLYARAAGLTGSVSAWRLRIRSDSRAGSCVCVPEPARRATVDGSGPADFGYHFIVLGELRGERRPQWARSPGVACLSERSTSGVGRQGGSRSRADAGSA
jgi:Carboxylesterase family